jgi:hypothetical protein
VDDGLLDSEITGLLRAYGGAAAIPVDRIARALGLSENDAMRRLEQRLLSLAGEGRVRRSRVFPDRWLAADPEVEARSPRSTIHSGETESAITTTGAGSRYVNM